MNTFTAQYPKFSGHLPHQGEAEKARRRRQMERAARKQELKK